MSTGTAHETSGATTGLLLRYVRSRGGQAAVDEVLERSGVSYGYDDLTDESRWFSYDVRLRLFQAMVEVLDERDAPFEVGASAVRGGLSPSLLLLIRALGSPRQVFRQLPRMVTKFSTTSTMEVVELGGTHATIRYRLHDGYEHSRLDCRYAQGLLAAVPTVFGLARSRVVHEECESDGYPVCLYHVTWDRRSRASFGRRREDEAELVALRGQLHALQSAASDLVSSDDLTVALERIVARAGAAVVAPAYLCVVESPVGGDPLVHSAGLEGHAAADLAERLRAGRDLGPNAVVVDVSTARRHHGRLAALYPDGARGLAAERELLQAYAGHAGAALDQLVALESSRRGESRAQALLDLAHELGVATDDVEVAETVVAALPQIVGSQRATMMRWDASAGELRAIATFGFSDEQDETLLSSVLRPDETPELVEMLARREPTIIEDATATPVLRQLLRTIGSSLVIAVPLLATDTLLGVATVGWSAREDLDGIDQEVVERLRAVADQAAAALQNARLLGAVHHQLQHDALTALPNRGQFTRHLAALLRANGAHSNVAVLFCDLDRFKSVNDALGHAAGDELLRQIAGRLRGVIRPGDLVARLSGDEFAVVVQVEDVATATVLAGRVVSCFEEPFRVEGRDLRTTTSVGVAVHQGTEGDGDRLLRSADAAMYAAKQRGRNQVVTADHQPNAPAGWSLGDELETALTDEQLRLRFQPVVATLGAARPPGSPLTPRKGPQVVGAEAVVRWQHPRLGLLSPAAFLPLAEERGLVVDLDLWVLQTASKRLAATVGHAADPPYLAVNVSVLTLLDDRLVPAVRAVRRDHGLAPGQLVLEVIESRSLIDLPGVVERLTELRRMGVRVSLDDFGTGYSTLTWLHGLPIDQIKIDRSFVAPLPGDESAAALIRGVVALARELRIEVVAEGVETGPQLESIVAAGCDRVQGYLFGRPGASLARCLGTELVPTIPAPDRGDLP